jgi:hypothetical protein
MGEPIHREGALAAEAVRFAVLGGTFDTLELAAELEGSGATTEAEVARVCRQLERSGWLERSDPDSPVWHAGPRARRLGCEEVPAFRGENCEC